MTDRRNQQPVRAPSWDLCGRGDVFQTYARWRRQAGGSGQQQGKGQGLAQIQLPVSKEKNNQSGWSVGLTRLPPHTHRRLEEKQGWKRRMTVGLFRKALVRSPPPPPSRLPVSTVKDLQHTGPPAGFTRRKHCFTSAPAVESCIKTVLSGQKRILLDASGVPTGRFHPRTDVQPPRCVVVLPSEGGWLAVRSQNPKAAHGLRLHPSLAQTRKAGLFSQRCP